MLKCVCQIEIDLDSQGGDRIRGHEEMAPHQQDFLRRCASYVPSPEDDAEHPPWTSISIDTLRTYKTREWIK